MTSLYFLHPNKCGGLSVIRAFRNLGLQFKTASDLSLDNETVHGLYSGEGGYKLITGHIHELPIPNNKSELNIYFKILKFLYQKCTLVVPSRHPSNILQSFMHSHKTRFNNYCKEYYAAPDLYPSQHPDDFKKLLEYGLFLSCLKQTSIGMSESIKSQLLSGKLLSPVCLHEEDEIENLCLFIENYRAKFGLHNLVFHSQTSCLFAPYLKLLGWSRMLNLVFNGWIKAPDNDSNRSVYYYDVEKISDEIKDTIDELLCVEFSKEYSGLKVNSSSDKPSLKASNIDLINSRLLEIVPCEFMIYANSQL